MHARSIVRKKTYLAFIVVDHDILRLYVSMHNALRMAEVQCLPERLRLASLKPAL
jgi:hypothetical protein